MDDGHVVSLQFCFFGDKDEMIKQMMKHWYDALYLEPKGEDTN